MQRIKIKDNKSIPTTLYEVFMVKDGQGRVVETWRHLYTKDGQHHYDVAGYSNNV